MKRFKENRVCSLLLIAVGAAIGVLGLNFFLVPCKIAAGGFSGIATILYYLFGWPVGLVILALNIPFFILSFRRLGKRFALRTLFGMLVYSTLADVIPIWQVTSEPFLAAVYGGLLMGVGLGICFYMGGSTGGSDLLAKLVSDVVKSVSVSTCVFIIDCVVIFFSGMIFNVQAALFAIVSLFLTSKMIDFFTDGMNRARAYLIITSEHERVRELIVNKMQRGVTELFARGGYSGRETVALLCMLERRSEVVRLKQLVEEVDEYAFFIAWDAREVYGIGFSKPKINRLKKD